MVTVVTGPFLGPRVAAAGAGIQLDVVGGDHEVSARELTGLTFAATASTGRLRGAQVTLDGEPLPTHLSRGALRWTLPALEDGRHSVSVSVERPFGLPRAGRSFGFTLDTDPPSLSASSSVRLPAIDQKVTVSGRVEDGASVTIDGAAVELDDGRFLRSYRVPPAAPVRIVATDAAGNRTVRRVAVPVRVPETRAVHVSGYAWRSDPLREPILQMIEDGRINAVELDLKEEDGYITYRSALPYHREIGAVRGLFDLKKVTDELHERGVRVIGRVVAFRDPVLAKAAWDAGQRSRVIQTPGHEPYAGYGGFTNFADPGVRRYNVDIAVEAARLGVDDILYDYVRRPDGPLDSMVFPGLKGPVETSVAGFLAESKARLRPLGAYQGASVFGIAVNRPEQIGQDITKMAEAVDYIAPMVYPSHWNKGEYDVANPDAQPYPITLRSLQHFSQVLRRSRVAVVPWLQDFTLATRYGPNEVRAQLKAAHDAGIDSWIMWDPAVSYTTAAYPPH